MGQNVGVSILSFDGRLLATPPQNNADRHNPPLPGVTLAHSTVQQWLITRPTYLLANDTLGQRELVVLQPIVVPNKSVARIDPSTSQMRYSKPLLRFSVPPTPIDQPTPPTLLPLPTSTLAPLS